MKIKGILRMSGAVTVLLAAMACSTQNGSQSNSALAETSAEVSSDSEKLSENIAAKQDIYLKELTPLTIIYSKKEEPYPDNVSLRLSYYYGLKAEDEGYEALNKSFADLIEANKKQLYSHLESNKDIIGSEEENAKDSSTETVGMNKTVDLSIRIKRADNIAVSFLNETYEFFGGVHPVTMNESHNFNSKTGQEIKFEEVVKDKDEFYKVLIKTLEDDGRAADFFEDYKETIKEELNNNKLKWNLLDKAIEITFDSYEVAAYAVGQTEVEISAQEHPELFNSGFFINNEAYAKYLDLGDGKELRLSADKAKTAVSYDIAMDKLTADADKKFDKISITVGGVNGETKEYNLSGLYNYEKKSAAVLHAESGATWLYIASEKPDAGPVLDVFKLSEQGSEFVSTYEGILWDYISGPDNFIIYNLRNLLGRHIIYRHYSLASDGLPAPKEETYKYAFYEGIDKMKLKTSVKANELNGGAEASETALPAGTVFYAVSTDGTAYCDIRTEEGKLYRLNLSIKDNNVSINGISQDKLMEQQSAGSDKYSEIKSGMSAN